jgi:protein involved in polysaccharide export with SLBB domain
MSLRLIFFSLFCPLALFVQGGAAPKATETQTVGGPVTDAPSDVPTNYQLMPGDVVDIRFFYNPELNEQGVAIRPDGRIALQIVGDVVLANKTPEEARKYLQQLYASELLTPSVTIQVRKFASAKIFVSGEVPKPGLIELEGPMTIIAALGEAGGITIKGNRKKVVLIRKASDGKPNMRKLVLFETGRVTEEALMPLRPFDVILVPESKVARIDRWVDQWLRQLSPANLVVGFQYLKQSVNPIPVF